MAFAPKEASPMAIDDSPKFGSTTTQPTIESNQKKRVSLNTDEPPPLTSLVQLNNAHIQFHNTPLTKAIRHNFSLVGVSRNAIYRLHLLPQLSPTQASNAEHKSQKSTATATQSNNAIWEKIGRVESDIEDAAWLMIPQQPSHQQTQPHSTHPKSSHRRRNRHNKNPSNKNKMFTHPPYKLLKSGGLRGDKYIDSVSYYDFQSHNWTQLPSMSNGSRHGHSMLPLDAEYRNIVIIGGFNSQATAIPECEVADFSQINNTAFNIPPSQSYTNLQPSHNRRRKHSQNSEESSQQPFGERSKSESISIRNGSKKRQQKSRPFWDATRISPMLYGVTDSGTCANHITQPNRLFVCGGLSSEFKPIRNVCFYDGFKDEWKQLPSLNSARHQCSAAIWNHHCLVVVSGQSHKVSNSYEILDLRDGRHKFSIFKNNTNNAATNTANANNNTNPNHISNIVASGLNAAHTCGAVGCKSWLTKRGGGNVATEEESGLIVAGHRNGLFVECNMIEALEMRTAQWHPIATFSQMDIDTNTATQKHITPNKLRFSNGLRFLTVL